jgi:Lon protease-like protein
MGARRGSVRPEDLPGVLPVFPLPGALLLPRGQMPLNIFEPRYLAMIDDALGRGRVIGMIQPELSITDEDEMRRRTDKPGLCAVGCAGRITSFAETGDGRYVIALTGLARFRVLDELPALTPYRQCRVDFGPYLTDLEPRRGEGAVDRPRLLKTFKAYLDAHKLEADWDGVQRASNEALVNALSMMAPYGPADKQALLEAEDLRTRAEVLIALTEFVLARASGEPGPPLN